MFEAFPFSSCQSESYMKYHCIRVCLVLVDVERTTLSKCDRIMFSQIFNIHLPAKGVHLT